MGLVFVRCSFIVASVGDIDLRVFSIGGVDDADTGGLAGSAGYIANVDTPCRYLSVGGYYEVADVEFAQYGIGVCGAGGFCRGNLEVCADGIGIVLEAGIGGYIGLVGRCSEVAIKHVDAAYLDHFVVEPACDFTALALVGFGVGGEFMHIAGLVERIDYLDSIGVGDGKRAYLYVGLGGYICGYYIIVGICRFVAGEVAGTCGTLVSAELRNAVRYSVCRDCWEYQTVVAASSRMAVFGQETLALVVNESEPIVDSLVVSPVHNHLDRTVRVAHVVAAGLGDVEGAGEVARTHGQRGCAWLGRLAVWA